MNYVIEFRLFVWRLLPPILKKDFWLSFVRVCLSGVEYAHAEFIAFRQLSLKNVTYTNQSVSLESYLQNEVHPSIHIEDNTNVIDPVFLYTENHGQSTPFILSEAHTESFAVFSERHLVESELVGFVVFVPTSINKDLVRSLVNRVNLLSVNYQIQEL